MAKFVNLKKRSVALPKGFKDLGELLINRHPEQSNPIIFHEPESGRAKAYAIEEVRLGDLPCVLQVLFNPEFPRRELSFCPPDESLLMGLWWNEPLTAVAVSISLLDDKSQVAAASRFLTQLGKVPGPSPLPKELVALLPENPPVLHYETFAGNALELCGLLHQFSTQFLKWPPNAVVTCVLPRRDHLVPSSAERSVFKCRGTACQGSSSASYSSVTNP